jgi:carboxypeptidase Q
VIGELRGATAPDEVVVIGAHIDSWDVGQGAHDDGAGVCAVMEALDVLRRLGLQPKRTIRVVLFTNEENGLRGAKAYAETHAAEIGQHVLAVEMDLGGFAPWGFDVDDGLDEEKRATEGGVRLGRMQARMADVITLFEPLGATKHDIGGAGSDVQPLTEAGVPGLGLATDSRTYFDYHHTEADTLDKVDPVELAQDVAALAVMAFVVADMPDRLDAE